MQKITSDNLAVVRCSKLEVAQWIAAGLAKCPNAAASMCLARYAAEQLQSAALIPPTRTSREFGRRRTSLLQSALRDKRIDNGKDCVRILASVSQSIVTILATESRKHLPATEAAAQLGRLIERERKAAAFLGGIKLAA